MEGKKEKITKKDLGYWILILIGLICIILTLKLSDNASAVDYIGFAATLTSLLLSVVAIIYSFYQNSTYTSTSEKLESSANKIKKITRELAAVSEVRSILEEMKLESQNFNHSLISLQQVVSTIENGVSEVKGNLSNANLAMFQQFDKESSKQSSSEINFINFEAFLNSLNSYSVMTFYLHLQIHNRKLKLNSREFLEWYIRNFTFPEVTIDDSAVQFYRAMIQGTLLVYEQQLNLFSVNMDTTNDAMITKFNPEFEKALNAKVKELLASKDDKAIKYRNIINDFIETI
ncbi:hypothetical protein [Peribacillus huizhouensis]|uniref:Phage abortive infection protein n=1 Tax=Peribacillus huizhouensis TaxID=1501239 RepID=A0ABR6CX05_9BACI|nr:hypothetical protein [Peribacillus huizhouensis]MBA9029456.1 hypothetical protein [Peribacillus huizhouensis]